MTENKKTALITGSTGQDAFYLTKLLIEKGYTVHGIVRRHAHFDLCTLKCLPPEYKINLHYGDVTDASIIYNLIGLIKPDELYHLAAQSHVQVSFQNPDTTYQINTGGTLNILNAIKMLSPKTRLYFAGTSEQFGNSKDAKQSEDTPFNPQSPYAVSKVAAFNYVKNYRESYGLFACSGICFNHESPYRPYEFVTAKIVAGAIRAKKFGEKLKLGNIEAKRDWGFAGDYVNAMWLMLQQDKPDDFVIGTGELHSIKELLEIAFGSLGLKWEDYIEIDNAFKRPVDVNSLCANPAKIMAIGWKPTVSFEELIKMMLDAEKERWGVE